jgi:hypothetical protein
MIVRWVDREFVLVRSSAVPEDCETYKGCSLLCVLDFPLWLHEDIYSVNSMWVGWFTVSVFCVLLCYDVQVGQLYSEANFLFKMEECELMVE